MNKIINDVINTISEKDETLNDQEICLMDDNFDFEDFEDNDSNDEMLEALPDNRVWESYVEDIKGGDNFADYCKYLFKMLENENYYDN